MKAHTSPLRLRRILAWSIDVAPLWAGPLLAVSTALTLALLQQEAAAGVGIFDPSLASPLGAGGDPARAALLRQLDGTAPRLLLAQGLFCAFQLLLGVLAGATLGQIACGLRVVAEDGEAVRGRVILRYLLRALLLAAPLGVCALYGARPALRSGAQDGAVVSWLGALLAVALADHAAAAISIARDGAARGFWDRLLGTALRRAGAQVGPAAPVG